MVFYEDKGTHGKWNKMMSGMGCFVFEIFVALYLRSVLFTIACSDLEYILGIYSFPLDNGI